MNLLRNKYIDTVIIFVATFLIVYAFRPQEPINAHETFNIFFYVMSVTALFYGFVAGGLFLALYIVAAYLYSSFELVQISHFFISLFIFSEFHYFWSAKIQKQEEINKHLRERMEELTSAYYILKISHDEMEKSYILKPYSIRNIFEEVKKLIKMDKKRAFEEFLFMFKQRFKIESASLFFKTEHGFKKEKTIGKNFDLNLEDPLIKESLNEEKLFVSVSKNTSSEYLAVIPISDLNENLKGIFVIKELPFFSLSQENLLVMSLFLNYFLNSFEKITKYSKYGFDEEITAEIDKLLFIYKNYQLQSHIVITPEKEVLDKLRTSDLIYETQEYVMVILPFTTKNGVKQFIQRTELENYEIIPIKDSLEKIVNEIKKTLH